MHLLFLLLAGILACAAQVPPASAPAAAPPLAAPAPAPLPAEALPEPENLTALQLTAQLIADFTEVYGPGTLYARCKTDEEAAASLHPAACDAGANITCCGYVTSAAGEKLPDVCVRFRQGECPRTYPGREGAPCGPNRSCYGYLVCCDEMPYLGGNTSVAMPACERPTAADRAGQQVCSASNAAGMAAAAPQPQQPSDPHTLAAVDLTAQLVADFTAANGRGSLFAFCRSSASPCDSGLICCGTFEGSTEGDKLQLKEGGIIFGVCAPASQCPQTHPGLEGGPCGLNRTCAAGLVCCDSRPFQAGLAYGTAPVPTCQRASGSAEKNATACPNIPASCSGILEGEFAQEAPRLLGTADLSNSCTPDMTSCRSRCKQAMMKLGYQCVVALRGTDWTLKAMSVCNLKTTDEMSPCVLEGVPQSNQSYWGAVLPYVCPTAVPLNCSCAAMDPNCLNALFWLGHRCARFLAPAHGFRRTDTWWYAMYSPQPGLVQCPFTSYNWPIGNATASTPKPPCPDAPLPDLAALQGPTSTDGGTAGGADSGSSGTSAGAIAGIAVGVATAVVAAAAVGSVLLRRRRKRATLAAKASGAGGPRDEFIDMSGAAGSKGLSGSRDELEDPLLSYISNHLKTWESMASSGGASNLSRPSTISQRSSGGVDVAPWEFRFNDLRIVKKLGQGSFAQVFLGYWHHTPVAAKILLAGLPPAASNYGGSSGGGSGAAGSSILTPEAAAAALSLPAAVLAKLEEEARLLASLRHPAIANFLGFSRMPACLMTEYCQRGSLMQVLEAAAKDPALAAELPWKRRLSMLLDAAVGMLYLHSRPSPIIHRDLKSPNLLVDGEWHVKVTDFGLSRCLEECVEAGGAGSSSLAATNPRWLAPELLVGKPATLSTDVYAFGIVMAEMVTWQLPWGRRDPWQIVGAVLHGNRPEVPPADRLPGLDAAGQEGLPAYLDLMHRCWAQQAAERPDFEAVVVELRGQLEAAGGMQGAPADMHSGLHSRPSMQGAPSGMPSTPSASIP